MPTMASNVSSTPPFDSDAAIPARVVRTRRGPRARVDPALPVAVWDEMEIQSPGVTVPTRVVILAGAECRFTCVMCDLWRHTLAEPTKPGRLPEQVRLALGRPWQDATGGHVRADAAVAAHEPFRWIKLYNGSNFFDPRSVPSDDLPAIADLVVGFSRVVVENHPRLTDDAVPRFRDRCRPRLEVAMGLETVHEDVLARLKKRMTLDDFAAACARLTSWDVDIRAFALLGLPWVEPAAAVEWCGRAVGFAAAHGVRHVSIVPTRSGNGFLDALAGHGRFTCPDATMLERAAETLVDRAARSSYGAGDTLVTVDLWDFERLAGTCPSCAGSRRDRLARMNLAQRVEPAVTVSCGCCP